MKTAMFNKKNLSDMTVFYSPDLNMRFTLRDMENTPSDQQSDSEVPSGDAIKTFFRQILWDERRATWNTRF